MIRFVSAGVVSAFATCLLTVCGTAQAQTLPISLEATVMPSIPKPLGLLGKTLPVKSTDTVKSITVEGVFIPFIDEPARPFVPLTPTSTIAQEAGAAAASSNLSALVAAHSVGDALDGEASCLATAVYFEARGESLDGQLAVAQVVMNRAGSGRYPATWCAVVKQRAQFSFVRSGGRFPAIKAGCAQWAKAQAIARVATKRLASMLSDDVLWYHANYVAPSWGRRLSRVSRIGAHIFYRS